VETARTAGRPDAAVFRRLSDQFGQYAGAHLRAQVYFRADAANQGAWPDDPFRHVFAAE
jgi:hypothetical protein